MMQQSKDTFVQSTMSISAAHQEGHSCRCPATQGCTSFQPSNGGRACILRGNIPRTTAMVTLVPYQMHSLACVFPLANASANKMMSTCGRNCANPCFAVSMNHMVKLRFGHSKKRRFSTKATIADAPKQTCTMMAKGTRGHNTLYSHILAKQACSVFGKLEL